MFALPVTGWVMVSASTLNVDTVLFGVIPWPHLPVLPTLDGREAIAQLFHTLHEQSGHILIAMVLLHSAAALKHHLVDRDDVLLRMTPVWSSRAWRIKLGAAALGVIAIAAGLTAYQWSDRQAAIVAAGNAEVSFIADVTSADTPGVFADANVTALIDVSDPASSVLEATVVTASVSSDDSGVDGSIRDPDWFDIETHPEAFFASTLIEPSDDPDVLQVSGPSPCRLWHSSSKLAASTTGTCAVDAALCNQGSSPTTPTIRSAALSSSAAIDPAHSELTAPHKYKPDTTGCERSRLASFSRQPPHQRPHPHQRRPVALAVADTSSTSPRLSNTNGAGEPHAVSPCPQPETG